MAVVRIIIKGDDQASGAIARVSGTFNNLWSVVGGFMASSAILGLGRQITQLGKDAFNAVAGFERMQLVMQSMAASELVRTSGGAMSVADAFGMVEGKTKSLIGWLENLAIESPFGTEDVQNAFMMAQRYGFLGDEAQRLTKIMLDWAAATGQPGHQMERVMFAMGQMRGGSKVMMQDVNQLIAAGISFDYMASAMGTDVAKLRENIADGLDPTALLSALTEKLGKDYAGLGEKSQDTLFGMVASLEDLKGFRLRDFFTAAFEEAKPVLKEVVTLLRDPAFTEKIKGWGADFGRFVGNVVNLRNVFSDLAGGKFASFGKMLYGLGLKQNTVEDIMQFAFNVKELFNGNLKPLDFLAKLGVSPELLEQVDRLIQNIIATAGGFDASSLDQFLPILEKIGGLLVDNLVKGLKFVNDNWSQFSTLMKATGMVLVALTGIVLGLIVVLQSLVGAGIDTFSGLVNAFKMFGEMFASGLGTFAAGFLNIWRGWWTMVKSLFSGDLEGLKSGFRQWVASLGAIVSGLFQMIGAIALSGLTFIIAPFALFFNSVIAIFTNLYNVLVGHSIVPDMMMAILNSVTGGLLSVVLAAMSSVQSFVQVFFDAKSRATNAIKNMIDAVITRAGSLTGSLASIGNKMVEGLVTAIYNGVGAVAEAITYLIQSALDAGNETADVNSPSKKTMWTAEMMLEGLMRPFKDFGGMSLAMSGVTGSMAGPAGNGRSAAASVGQTIVLQNYGTIINGNSNSRFSKSLRGMR